MNYSMLRKQYNIPENHTLQKVSYHGKDRATYSEERTIIVESDDNGNRVSCFMERHYADAYGNKIEYHKVDTEKE